jgi:hypothetical protein
LIISVIGIDDIAYQIGAIDRNKRFYLFCWLVNNWFIETIGDGLMEVFGYKLEQDWFNDKRSMIAFAYAIERVCKLKEQVSGGGYYMHGVRYETPYNLGRIIVNLDGINSEVLIDEVWVVGDSMNPDNGDKIVATKKEVDEFFSLVRLTKEVRIKK